MKSVIATSDNINLALTLGRFLSFGPDLANQFDGRVFAKVITSSHENHFLILLYEKAAEIFLEISPEPDDPGELREIEGSAREILGLCFDLNEFYDFAADDTIMASLAEEFRGMRPTLFPNLFELIISSIAAQQINLRFAFTVKGRLVERFGHRITHSNRPYYAFPTPKCLSQARVQDLRTMQFTQRKSEYIIGVAQLTAKNELDLAEFPGLSNTEIIDKITAVRGLGRWSADWLLVRGLGRGNVCPVGDLGVRKAIEHYYFEGTRRTEAELREFSAAWGEHANLATHYLLKGWMERNQGK